VAPLQITSQVRYLSLGKQSQSGSMNTHTGSIRTGKQRNFWYPAFYTKNIIKEGDKLRVEEKSSLWK
jgi:hypothetical protein